jgi:hypothetical protein
MGNNGISLYSDSSRVENIRAFSNRGIGIVAGTASNNTSSNNGWSGIYAGTVNNNSSCHNVEAGIIANTAIGNTLWGNGGYGLQSLGGYANNVFNDNNGGGAQVQGGIQMGVNVCNNASCP